MTYNGPVPLFNNPPVNFLVFQPRVFQIDDIFPNGKYAVVQTAEAYDYELEQLVRFLIPPEWGITQLNNQLAYVIEINSLTTLTVDIDINFMDGFQTGDPTVNIAQVIAVGDRGNVTQDLSMVGSFQNIS